MEVRLHFVMLEELEGSEGVAELSAGNSDTPVGQPPVIARISIIREADPGGVDFDFDEEL